MASLLFKNMETDCEYISRHCECSMCGAIKRGEKHALLKEVMKELIEEMQEDLQQANTCWTLIKTLLCFII